MGKLIYNGAKIIPAAPAITFVKNNVLTEASELIGQIWNITINGTIIAYKGSPNSSGIFHTIGGYPADESLNADSQLKAILVKQQAIRNLFDDQGHWLEFQSDDLSAPLKCRPKNVSIEFTNRGGDPYFNLSDYTITCEADVVYLNGTPLNDDNFTHKLKSASEVWNLETNEDEPENELLPRTYRLTHTVTAQGNLFYDENGNSIPAWQQAKNYVLTRLGIDSTIILSSGVINLPEYYGGFNHVRSEQTNEVGGAYSVNETWILSSGTSLETFTVNTITGNDDGRVRVGIEGQITGLEQRNSDLGLTVTKYTNALSKFDIVKGQLLSRAQNYSGHTLNIQPVSTTVGRNPVNGIINYAFDYDNRPSNLLTDSVSEVITMTESKGVNVFGVIGIIGRSRGPILQDIGTKLEATRNLSIEVVYGSGYTVGSTALDRLITNHPAYKAPYSTEILSIVSAIHPLNSSAVNNIGENVSTVFVSENNENWEPNSKRYSRNVTWIME